MNVSDGIVLKIICALFAALITVGSLVYTSDRSEIKSNTNRIVIIENNYASLSAKMDSLKESNDKLVTVIVDQLNKDGQ